MIEWASIARYTHKSDRFFRLSVEHAWMSKAGPAFCGATSGTAPRAATGNQPRCKACIRSVSAFNSANLRRKMDEHEATMKARVGDAVGRIRLMPEAHCACGHWEQVPDAEGAGKKRTAEVLVAAGWRLSRIFGWMCPSCSGAARAGA